MRRALSAFAMSLFLTSSSAFAEEIFVHFVTVPEQSLGDTRQVAVLDFTVTGVKKPAAASQLAAAVMREELGDELRGIEPIDRGPLHKRKNGHTFQGSVSTAYTVVVREQMALAIEQLQLDKSGLISNDQAKELGEFLSADAVIIGSLIVTETDTKKKCSKSTGRKRTSTIKASVRVIDVATATNAVQANESVVAESEDCTAADVESMQNLRNTAIETAMRRLARSFTPHFEWIEFDLAHTDGAFKERTKRAEEQIHRYIETAPAGQRRLDPEELREPYQVIVDVLATDDWQDKAWYMKGVILELASDFEGASEAYGTALQFKRGEDRYRQAKTRTQWRLGDVARLRQLGVEVVPISLEGGPVYLSLKKGVKAYAEPSLTAPVVETMRGDVDLEKLGAEGDFIRVALFNGDEAYVHLDDIVG